MAQYIDKDALVAEIERRLCLLENGTGDSEVMKRVEGVIKGYKSILSFLDTLEVKEIPETAHTEYKKIKKLCEIQRYDENGKAYSIMLPDTRLFMSKINDIIDVIDNIDSRLQIMEQKIEE